MRDISLFLINNSLAAKMRKGIRNLCNGVSSTSTLNQHKSDANASIVAAPSLAGSHTSNVVGSPLTLEQMLLQLDLEEAAAADDYGGEPQRRMSCVNNSDVLRSARDALNQYPRFSLDGRDALYRSSFRASCLRTGGFGVGRRSVCCSGSRERLRRDGYHHHHRPLPHPLTEDYEEDNEINYRLPSTVGGARVVWCKPGIVAKLMGLDAVPVQINNRHGKRRSNPNPDPIRYARKENLRRMWRNELEKQRLVMGDDRNKGTTRRDGLPPCSGHDHCIMNPIRIAAANGREEWHFRRPH